MKGAPATVVELRTPGGDPISVAVKGFSSNGALLVAVTDATLLAAATGGHFHCLPDVLDELVATAASADRGGRSNSVTLHAGPGIEPPSDLDADAAAAWLRSDDAYTDAGQWFLSTWERAGTVHRTVWDYLHPASGHMADALSSAMQFVLDRQPGVPIDAIEANHLLSSLTVDVADPLGELAAVLEAMEVRSELLDDDGPLGFSMGSDTAEWDCLAEVVGDTWLVVYAMLPVVIGAGGLPDAPKLIGRINARLQIGCLLAEEDTGTTMYRAAVDLSAPTGHTSSIRRLLDQVHHDVLACLDLLDESLALETTL